MFRLKTFSEFRDLQESTSNNEVILSEIPKSFEEKHRISPLHIAIKEGDIETIISLVERGEDVNSKNSFGYTPLHWAVEENSFQLVEYLVQYGANVDIENIWGRSPLHNAKSKSDKRIYPFLFRFSKQS